MVTAGDETITLHNLYGVLPPSYLEDSDRSVDLLEAELPSTTLTADDQFNYDEAPSPASSVHHENQVPPPVSSHSTSQPPVHLTTSAPEIRSEKQHDSAPRSRFIHILGRWKKRIRESAVSEPRHLSGIQSRSADNVDASKRTFSTIAEGRGIPRTVRRVVEPKKEKKKKKKARPRADGDRDRDTHTSGGRSPNPGPSSDVALPSVMDDEYGGGTSAGYPPRPISEAQQTEGAGRPSTWRIGLREEPGKATLSITFPTWLCCRSSGTEEE